MYNCILDFFFIMFRARIFKLLNSPRIDSKESIPPANVASSGILEQSMGAIGTEQEKGVRTDQPQATQAGGIDSLESFPLNS
jgi:hypothetical protein